MSDVIREPRFSFFGWRASLMVPPHGAGAGHSSGCVPLSLEKKPAAKKSSAFAPALFLSVPTELEPYSRLNRTTCGSSQIVRFSTSRQGTPHCVSGERCFFVIRGCGLRRPFLCSESQDFNRDTYPERCQTFLDTKEDTRIFPTNEPVDFFPAAPSGSRNLPLPMVGAH